MKYSALLIFCFLSINLMGIEKATFNNYIIDLQFDTVKNCFKGKMIVSWENTARDSIKNFPFYFSADSIELQLKKVSIPAIKHKVKYKKNGFIISLEKEIAPEERFTASIDFESNPDPELFNKKQWHFVDAWMPQLQCFENNAFNPHFQQSSNYIVRIKYPEDYVLTTSGKESLPKARENMITVKSTAEAVPSFGIVMAKGLIKKQLTTKQGVLIRSFYYENDSLWGHKLLEYAQKVIEFYSDTIGFYPHSVLSIIPGYDKPYGGWPLSPNIIMIHRGIDQKGDYAETHGHWITAHEIGHQYWGYNYILEPKNYPEWFGISMGIYTDWLYSTSVGLKRNYPDFSYRYINGFKKGYNTTILQTKDSLSAQGFDWNNVIRHGKAFAVLTALRYELGDSTFTNIFKELLENYKGINVTYDRFKKICEHHSGKKLSWFFEQWYKGNKHLGFTIKNINRQIKADTNILQFGLIKTGDIQISKIQIKFKCTDKKSIIKEYEFSGNQELIRLKSKYNIKEIIVDPSYHYPIINRSANKIVLNH